ncbi:MAG: nucleoside triphosphate pyrophosphohydrolase [Pseudomonadota bacterium]
MSDETKTSTDRPQDANPRDIRTLLSVMAQLRAPDGCPWDVEQTFDTIAPFTIEEAYEVADAIARNDLNDLKEELGDLLFQTVFHAQMASEGQAFSFDDVVETVTTKMIRRHPHVFGNADPRNQAEQGAAWEEIKAQERAAKGRTSLLDDVPFGLPALTRAVKLQKRAANIGFDWPTPADVLNKLREETEELTDAMASRDADQIEDEFGDLLFVLANLSRHLKIDPEHALRRANEKFSRRFRHVETRHNAAEDAPSLETMEEWWVEAKAQE